MFNALHIIVIQEKFLVLRIQDTFTLQGVFLPERVRLEHKLINYLLSCRFVIEVKRLIFITFLYFLYVVVIRIQVRPQLLYERRPVV